jgi:hypothetical protein
MSQAQAFFCNCSGEECAVTPGRGGHRERRPGPTTLTRDAEADP